MSHWSLVLLLAAVFVTVAVGSPTTELNESKSTAVGKRFTGWRVNCLTKWLECYLRIRVRVIIIIDFEGVVLSHQEFDFPYYIYAELNPDHILTSGTVVIPAGDDTQASTPDLELDGDTFTNFVMRFHDPVSDQWVNDTFGHCGLVKGDPHLATFDGYRFNFNGFCSYVLTKECGKSVPSFQINADFRGRDGENPYEPPTRMVALDIYNDGKSVVRVNADNSIQINGKTMIGNYTAIQKSGGTVKHNGPKISIDLVNPAVSVNWDRHSHAIAIGFEDSEMFGKVCGLLGNADGNPHNDFIMPDGKRTSDSTDFGNSWLIPGSCPTL